MKITVNPEKTYQTFRGIGASGAWWAQEVGGWDFTFDESGKTARDRISELLFNKENGIGMNIYRYNIGGGSTRSTKGEYSQPLRRADSFETENGYDWNRDANAVYMMKQAVKDGAGEVILFVNSPIEKLTRNGKAHGEKTLLPKDNLPEENYGAFCEYCLDVTEHFVNEGLPIRYLSPVNEPLWVWNGGQEGCHYKAKSVAKVMKLFALEMKKRKSLDGVKLSGAENGDIRWYNKTYTRALFKNKEVYDRVDGVDVHSYFLNPVKPFFSNRPAYLKRFQKYVQKHYPDKNIVVSEWTHMQGGRDKSMNSALEAAKVMMEDITVLNAASWQHWIAVSEVDYCDGLIYINLPEKTFETTKRLYVTGNFSKYIPLDSVRIASESDDPEVKTVAFKKGKKTVAVLANFSENSKDVSFGEFGKSGYLLAVTDKDNDLTEKYVSENEAVTLTPRSVVTAVFG